MRRVLTGLLLAAAVSGAQAQDVPGIEICTVEKTMERRTSCLQSNVDFLAKTINKMALDQQTRLDAAKRQIETLQNAVIALQKSVASAEAAAAKAAAPKDAAPKDAAPKDAPAKDAPAKEPPKAAKDAPAK